MKGEPRGAEPERRTAPRKRPWWRRPLLNFLARVVPPLLRVGLRALQATLRVQYVNADALKAHWARGEHVIVSSWHNHLLVLPVVAAGVPMCIMVSQHRDGEIATRLLAAWGISTVRGSATRGAVGGFLRLVHAFRHGTSLAILPDGPRGPRCVAKPGVIRLAKALDAPIFPIAYAADRVRRLRSWDRLLIPLPFARLTIEVGEPLRVAAHASADELEAYRRTLEERLNEITASVEARVELATPERSSLSRMTGGRGLG
jgi:hypothetical protein